MPLTPAERQRRYRERLKLNDPQKWKEVQEKNLIRTKNKYIPIRQLSESEKKVRRKEWRRSKQQITEEKSDKNKFCRKVYKKRYNKITHENEKLREKVNTLIRKNKALKKKIYRYTILQAAHSQDNDQDKENISNLRALTPQSKTESFVSSLNISLSEKEKVKKELFHKNILCESIKHQYELASSNEQKNTIKNIVNNSLVKKYRTKTKLEAIIGLKGRIRVPTTKIPVKHEALAQKIRNFFLQDDVSRATAGKKETKTVKKNKMQRRYLLESMKKLCYKFIQETKIPVSYTTFTRYKPFFVLSPNLSNRETCACKKHGNIEFKYATLKTLSIVKAKDLDLFMKSIVCDTHKRECMYSECKCCLKENTTVYNLSECNLDDKVSWLEWTVQTIEYQKENKYKTAKRMVKIIKSGTIRHLIMEFKKALVEFKVHCYNIFHQYKWYKYLKENLSVNEVLIHCDFSENYACKLHKEIQALHFGASQIQISLHTSVVYGQNSLESFCTFSDSTKHTPEAIWAHLSPILRDVRKNSPQVNIVHFYSDGPTSQYRQKKNFFLFSTVLESLGFSFATWNFFEAAHGKGAADGIGGVIKRTLDKKVAYHTDVTDAKTAYDALKDETTVKMYLIKEEDINEVERGISTYNLVAVPQTMQIHQIASSFGMSELFVKQEPYVIGYRKLSCFCRNERSSVIKGFCYCYSLKEHSLLKKKGNPFLTKKRKIIYSSDPESSDTDNDVLIAKTDYSATDFQKPTYYNIDTNKPSTSKVTIDSESSDTDNDGLIAKIDDNVTDFQKQTYFNIYTNKPSKSKVTIDSESSDTDNDRQIAKTDDNDGLIAKTDDNATDFQKPTYFNIYTNKPSTSKVTILSNVKVNHKLSEFQKMTKPAQSYNVSSFDLKKDFSEMFDDSDDEAIF